MRWKVGHHDLKSNGIRVYYFYDSGGTTHICSVGFRVGSVHDPINTHGLAYSGRAHFIEHVKIRGSRTGENDPVYNMIYRYFGGMEYHNIFTNYTVTHYGGPGLYYRRYMHEVMPVIVETLKSMEFGQLDLGIESTVINNEYRQHDLDNIESQLDGSFLNAMYDTNPVRNGVLGDVQRLRTIKPGVVKKFVEKHYVAENMFVIVFGPKRDEAISFARRYLDDWPYRGEPTLLDLNSFDRVPRYEHPRKNETARTGITQHYAMIGFPTECHDTADDAALEVIRGILERRLYDKLREKSRAFKKGTYHHPAFTERTLAHGRIGVWFATACADFAKYGQDTILSEFARLKEEVVSSDLLDGFRDSAREVFLGDFRNTPERVVEHVISAASNGDPGLTHMHSYPRRLNALTPRKLRNVANKYFNADGYTSVLISPA